MFINKEAPSLMQIPWLVPVDPAVYAADVKNVSFPVFRKCPRCKSAVRLHRNGFYPRYAVVRGMEYLFRICRYLCPSCQRTVSLLPLFLFSHFQHDKNSILTSLRAFFSGRKPPGHCSRQLISFWRRRFLDNLPAIISALRERGWPDALPDGVKEKAIKVADRLSLSPSDSTSKVNLENRVLANFMALSF